MGLPVFEGQLLADQQHGGDSVHASQLCEDQHQAGAVACTRDSEEELHRQGSL